MLPTRNQQTFPLLPERTSPNKYPEFPITSPECESGVYNPQFSYAFEKLINEVFICTHIFPPRKRSFLIFYPVLLLFSPMFIVGPPPWCLQQGERSRPVRNDIITLSVLQSVQPNQPNRSRHCRANIKVWRQPRNEGGAWKGCQEPGIQRHLVYLQGKIKTSLAK